MTMDNIVSLLAAKMQKIVQDRNTIKGGFLSISEFQTKLKTDPDVSASTKNEGACINYTCPVASNTGACDNRYNCDNALNLGIGGTGSSPGGCRDPKKTH
jgi:hypothetical protein